MVDHATDAIRVVGGAPLDGEVSVLGAKNAVLKHMVATLLAPGRHTLTNVPGIADVEIMGEVLVHVGAECIRSGIASSSTCPSSRCRRPPSIWCARCELRSSSSVRCWRVAVRPGWRCPGGRLRFAPNRHAPGRSPRDGRRVRAPPRGSRSPRPVRTPRHGGVLGVPVGRSDREHPARGGHGVRPDGDRERSSRARAR